MLCLPAEICNARQTARSASQDRPNSRIWQCNDAKLHFLLQSVPLVAVWQVGSLAGRASGRHPRRRPSA